MDDFVMKVSQAAAAPFREVRARRLPLPRRLLRHLLDRGQTKAKIAWSG